MAKQVAHRRQLAFEADLVLVSFRFIDFSGIISEKPGLRSQVVPAIQQCIRDAEHVVLPHADYRPVPPHHYRSLAVMMTVCFVIASLILVKESVTESCREKDRRIRDMRANRSRNETQFLEVIVHEAVH